MTTNTKKNIVWAIRILVAAVFVLSAYAKLYPSAAMGISSFETKYLGSIGFDGAFAKVFSRLIIGLEFSIAILILMPFYLKKIVIPVTIGLLTVFSIHLMMQVFGGDAGNCGCFGELIPMTPLQALIKNLITIGLLILPLTKLKEGLTEKKNLHAIFHVGLLVSLLMFVFIPQGGASNSETVEVKSGESEYSIYFENIGKENKILCFFSPTCEHCMETGKKLTELKAKFPGMMPEINILFMDEAENGSPEEIKAFFEFIGAEYSYKVLTIDEFIPIFWKDKNFPGVKYLYNGQERVFFDGTEDNEFNADKLMEEIKKEY